MSRSAADATCPWAMLLEAGTKLQNSSPQVFHIYPNSPAHAARATAMSSLLVALSGVTFAVTSQQVRCVTFPDPSPGFKVTYVICQNNALLVFCWPLKLPDGSAFKLAAVISNLLCNVMGPFEGWLQDKRLDADHPKVLHQAAADTQADLKVTSQEQHLKTRDAAAGSVESCLTPAAGHQFDLLMASVFHQLSVNGWHASALSTLFPTGVPATTGSQQASLLGPGHH
ncbi:TPA: hypothetical protein ACH3X2_002981 [Trebouxia sp. C0005]